MKKNEAYKGLKSEGRKGREWRNARSKLVAEFARMGITYCEARFLGICKTYPDGFAHVERRRNFGKWDTEERDANLVDVALLCNNCHDYIDVRLGTVEGAKELRKIIDRRKGTAPDPLADLKLEFGQ